MQRAIKYTIVVAIVLGLTASGVYAAYVLSPAPSPCASLTTSAKTAQERSPATSGVPAKIHGAIDAGTPGPAEGGVPPSLRAPIESPRGAELHGLSSGEVINVVAAENFWGSLVAQLGGVHVNVTSIITDPNTDPHEYQSNDSTAIAIKNAQYIVLNNVGYDSWADLLIASDGVSGQTILNIGDSLGVSETGGIVSGNPHLWYNPAYVNETVAWMFHNLTTIAPSLSGYFGDQYANLTASLGALYSEIGTIRQLFAGTEVASTESIFVYLANASGLDLVSPPAFMEAIAEGNDPPDPSVVTFQCQLESGNVRVLVFNAQTVTPITTSMKEIAQAHNVTVMSVTETIVPPGASFQAWMGGELNALYVALDANALGR